VRVCVEEREGERKKWRETKRERENKNITKYDLLTFCTFDTYVGRRKDCPEKFVSIGSAGSADVNAGGCADDVNAGGCADDVNAGGCADDVNTDGCADDVDVGGCADDVDAGGRADDVDAGGRADDVDAGDSADDVDAGDRADDVDTGGCGSLLPVNKDFIENITTYNVIKSSKKIVKRKYTYVFSLLSCRPWSSLATAIHRSTADRL